MSTVVVAVAAVWLWCRCLPARDRLLLPWLLVWFLLPSLPSLVAPAAAASFEPRWLVRGVRNSEDEEREEEVSG